MPNGISPTRLPSRSRLRLPAGWRGLAGLAGLVPVVALLGMAGCASRPQQPAPSVYPRPFQIIAHRGASARAPENTLPAFRAARRLGAVEVELDVQLSADDQVILFHDGLLEPKTGRPGTVRDHSLASLREMEIGSWFDASHPEADERFAGTKLTTLADLFAEMGRDFVYHVELKDGEADLSARVLEVVDRFALRDRVIVTSFRFEQLARMRALAPELPTCLLILDDARREGSVADWIARADAAGMREVGVTAREIAPEHVADAHARGLWIRAWGIKSLDDMQHAIDVGSNGMTIDWPEELIRRFLEFQGSAGAER